jgi:hypothetical protein
MFFLAKEDVDTAHYARSKFMAIREVRGQKGGFILLTPFMLYFASLSS